MDLFRSHDSQSARCEAAISVAADMSAVDLYTSKTVRTKTIAERTGKKAFIDRLSEKTSPATSSE